MLPQIIIAALLMPSSIVDSPVASRKAIEPKEREASCVVMIQNHNHGPQMNQETIYGIIKSAAVAGEAAKEVLGIDPETSHKRVVIWLSFNKTHRDLFMNIRIGLDPETSEGADVAQRYLDALLRRFGKMMTEANDTHRDGLAAELEILTNELVEASQERDSVQQNLLKLRATPGFEGMTPREILSQGNRLRMEARSARATLSSHRTMMERWRDGAPETRVKPTQELIEAWEDVVRFREEALAKLREQARETEISLVELAEFEARLA